MTTQPPDLKKLREVAERATPQDFDSAQIVSKGGWIECPGCGGEGWVELTADYCNYDDEAIGVQFYGVGQAHVNAEEFYRNFNPQTILAMLDAYEAIARDAERLRSAATHMSNFYGHVWDRVDGSLVIFPEKVNAFDEAFENLQNAACRATHGELYGIDMV